MTQYTEGQQKLAEAYDAMVAALYSSGESTQGIPTPLLSDEVTTLGPVRIDAHGDSWLEINESTVMQTSTSDLAEMMLTELTQHRAQTRTVEISRGVTIVPSKDRSMGLGIV